MRRFLALLVLTGCGVQIAPRSAVPESAPARFLYVWAGDKDGEDPDFLAVVDVRPESPTYGDVIRTEPVRMRGSMPHHLEYELPSPGRLLFANAHHHEQILLFDTEQADRPRLVRALSPPAPFRYPHDFVRLPNGNVLVSFLRSEGPSPLPGDTTLPGGHGGLAEVDPEGRLLRTSSAADSSISEPIRSYAMAVLPEIDRLVVTGARMMEPYSADVVQVWRLSDLALLRTLRTPPGHLRNGKEAPFAHRLPFEPRVMPDGSVLLSTYGCGFYRVTEIGTPSPKIRNVYTIEESDGSGCGVPVVVGSYWVMTVAYGNKLVALDVTDPAHPVEVSRLMSETTFRPHWIAKDPGSNRLIVGAEENGGEDRMLMARIDPGTGTLSWDPSLHSKDGSLGVSFRREIWPHGRTGEAFGHAALFRP